MHNTNEVARKHRGLRRAVAKKIRRYHDDLLLSLRIDNEQFVQQTFAKAGHGKYASVVGEHDANP